MRRRPAEARARGEDSRLGEELLASTAAHADVRAEMRAFVAALQADICDALEASDGAARFGRDAWTRPGGGGGSTRALAEGDLLERAAVNVSDVEGDLEAAFARTLPGEGRAFAAVGLSVVLHPRSPHVPMVHMNVRFLVHGERAWFGGGADLTPHYLVEEDAAHFHRTLRDVCERHEPGSYAVHKKACDDYFLLPHRGERRGVGGIFFDGLAGDLPARLAFVEDVGRAFLPAWLPIAERRRSVAFGERERRWQEIRRGRYVEFNLLDDRGTAFGLATRGRVESVLASLPPRARWVYDHRPEPGSDEERLVSVLRAPREWA